MKFWHVVAAIAAVAVVGAGIFLFLDKENTLAIAILTATSTPTPLPTPTPKLEPVDIEPQQPLANPPAIIKAIYATAYSAGNEKKLSYLINLIKTTELNALVVDVKDYSGYVLYNTNLPLPKKYNAVERRIPKLNKLIKRLHDEGIYVIGRVSVFQDPRLATARPDLALYSSSTGQTWQDNKGLLWMDTAAPEVWDYNIAIAKEISERGMDEVNLDYIRFASDGQLSDIKYPFWDEQTLKTKVLRDFFKHLREELPNVKLSADLFGLVTINKDGLGIGQHLEYALPYFDAVAPMVYPSHYFKGFIGFENPGAHPYEVVKYSLDVAAQRIKDYEKNLAVQLGTTTPAEDPRWHVAKLRPWFQDFDLGADYDAAKVKAQIQAQYDTGTTSASTDLFDGWMIWNASNVYTREALQTTD